jgi:hypothetical protein
MKNKQIELRKNISERIEFMADHWTIDDKSPFNFGGWKEEVVDQIVSIFHQAMKQEIRKVGEKLIGEDEEMLDMGVGNEDYWVEENEKRRLKNELRAEQRQRIEVSD